MTQLSVEGGNKFIIPFSSGEAPVTTISEFVARTQEPIPQIGKILHTEFSGVNLRGLPTHKARTRRINGTLSEKLEGVELPPNSMAIYFDLEDGELQQPGSALQLFFNQLELRPEEITRGLIMLGRVNEDIAESICPYGIAFLASTQSQKEGRSGLYIHSSGELALVPFIAKHNPTPEYRSELEARNDALLGELMQASTRLIMHPLVSRAIIEGATFMGQALMRRKMQVEFPL